jgi:hypothetical protein
MKTFETTAHISPDGIISLKLPLGVQSGEYRTVLVIEEQPIRNGKRPPLNFPVDHYGPWPSNLFLRREDIYGDDGR